jgi:hypothetical protein
MKALNIGIIFYIFYNQRTSKSNCGTTKTNPSMSSVLVWAFISKREEATNPFRRRSTVIKTVFGF